MMSLLLAAALTITAQSRSLKPGELVVLSIELPAPVDATVTASAPVPPTMVAAVPAAVPDTTALLVPESICSFRVWMPLN